MEKLDAETVDGLIAEYRKNQQIAQDARERNRKIADQLGIGQVFGTAEYVSITPAGRQRGIDSRRLMRELPQHIWAPFIVGRNRCRVVQFRKIKPKKGKGAGHGANQ